MIYLNIDPDTNRVFSAGKYKTPPYSGVGVENLPYGDISDYLYVNGEYVYDPLPKPDPPEVVENISSADMANAIIEGVNAI